MTSSYLVGAWTDEDRFGSSFPVTGSFSGRHDHSSSTLNNGPSGWTMLLRGKSARFGHLPHNSLFTGSRNSTYESLHPALRSTTVITNQEVHNCRLFQP